MSDLCATHAAAFDEIFAAFSSNDALTITGYLLVVGVSAMEAAAMDAKGWLAVAEAVRAADPSPVTQAWVISRLSVMEGKSHD